MRVFFLATLMYFFEAFYKSYNRHAAITEYYLVEIADLLKLQFCIKKVYILFQSAKAKTTILYKKV